MFPGMPPTDPRSIHGAANVRGALSKRDRWANREEAKLWLLGIKGSSLGKQEARENEARHVDAKNRGNGNNSNKRIGIWSKWDDRALALYVVCGIISRNGDAAASVACLTSDLYRNMRSRTSTSQLRRTLKPQSPTRPLRFAMMKSLYCTRASSIPFSHPSSPVYAET